MPKLDLSPDDQARYDEILCIADTKLVLAGWHMITIPNGRAIGDWNAICGMMQAHYGHARALYNYLSDYGLTRADAEWNRSRMEIRSSELLDQPPESWSDLILSTYLVERAVATLLTAYEGVGQSEQFAGLARKIGRETQFHFSYLHGWFKVLAAHRRQELDRSVAPRLEQILLWFGPDGAADPPFATGQRAASRQQLRAAFLDQARSDAVACGFSLDEPTSPVARWEPVTMRATSAGLPEKLFEMIRFKHTELAIP